jgi:hypothetical protein
MRDEYDDDAEDLDDEDDDDEAGAEVSDQELLDDIRDLLNDKMGLDLPDHVSKETVLRDLCVALHAHPGWDDAGGQGGERGLSEDEEDEEDEDHFDPAVRRRMMEEGRAHEEAPVAMMGYGRMGDDLDDDLGDEDLDDDQVGEHLVESIAEALSEKCRVVIDDPSDDPAEFIQQLGDALHVHPGWELSEDEPDFDDEDLDQIALAQRRRRRSAMSAGRLKAKLRLSSGRTNKPIVRKMTPERGRQVAIEQLKNCGYFKATKPKPIAARLSQPRKAKAPAGPVTPERGLAAAKEIVKNCPGIFAN